LTQKPERPNTRGEYAVEIRDLSLRFEGKVKPALKEVDVRIRRGDKVAIVGRSGSGKSSFIQCLYRLVDLEKDTSYHIFSQDAQALPLNELRSYFTCIPNIPFIFPHSIRKNIDPFDVFSDEEVEKALRDVKLLDVISKVGINASLEEEIDLSHGQRQLLAMARVLVRKSPIVVLDRSTSNVDERTDSIIQSVIRRKLQGRTVINITEKLKNILDYDLILVFE
jgi:ATP-binding cassette, subfamily C (CFTR/MRP), member 4